MKTRHKLRLRYAEKNYDVEAVGTTISREQVQLAGIMAHSQFVVGALLGVYPRVVGWRGKPPVNTRHNHG